MNRKTRLQQLLAFALIFVMCMTMLTLIPKETKAKEAEYGGDPSVLTGANWMSGISGDKMLYEINIPGTHDASMTWVYAPSYAAHTMHQYARTQLLSIPEQLNAGVRLFDVRISNVLGSMGLPPYRTQAILGIYGLS